MKTILQSGLGGAASTANTTEYWMMGSNPGTRSTTEANMQVIFRSAGTFDKLYVRLIANSIAATSTIRTRKNAANGGMSVSIGSSATGAFEDTVNSDTVAAADKFCFQSVPGAATNTLTVSIFQVSYAATTNTVTRHVALTGRATIAEPVTIYIPFKHFSSPIGATAETNQKVRQRRAGTFKNMAANVSANTITSATTVRDRKNAANGAIAVSITASTTGFFENTANSDTCAVGDDFNLQVVTPSVSGTRTITIQSIAIDFETTDSSSTIINADATGGSGGAAATRYLPLSGGSHMNSTESESQAKANEAYIFNNLVCWVATNPGTITTASTLRLRVNTANVNLVASITAATTGLFQDTTNTDTVAAADIVNISLTTGSGSGNLIWTWIAISYTASGTTFERSPSADSVTVSDSSLTRILSAARIPSSDSTTVSDASLTRQTQAFRTPSTDSVTVADASLTRVKTFPRVPSADSTTVSDVSTTRMLSAIRLPSTDSVTVTAGTATRTTQAFRSPSADTTTVIESSLTGSRSLARTPSTDTITVTDSSLVRFLSMIRTLTPEIITASDSSLTRILSAIRVPSTDTVSVVETSLDAIKTVGGVDYVRSPASENITVADSSLTRLLSSHRLPSADDITIGEGLTRVLSAIRSPSSDSVTAEDVSTTQSLTRIRAPDTEDITVTDSSLTRLLSASRIPSTDSTMIVDSSLTRIISLLRIPNQDTINISEEVTSQYTQGTQTFERSPTADIIDIAESSLIRILSASRSVSADTITISESSLTRMLSAIRIPSTDIVDIFEDIDSLHTTPGQFNRAPNTENVSVGENLTRALQLFRVPSSDSVTIGENISGGKLLERVTTVDTVNVVEQSLARIKSASRNVEDTSNVIEASLTRLLQAIRIPNPDTVTVSELQSAISHSRSITDTITVTEPVLQRIVTSIRQLGPEFVEVSEQVFYQAFHKFVFDSVTVAEQLFIEREALGGSMSYATPAEVRPLLGNLGTQRTDAQITLAIDSAYDEINRKTNRVPPNEWKDTEADFSIIKKIARYKAALEMSIGIKDFGDREGMQKEIDEMFTIIEEHDPGGALSNDMVISSDDETYALNESGIIWSTRYKNLRKATSSENDTTINPNT